MSGTAIRIIVFLVSFVFLILATASVAYAAQGEWGVWRVLLFAWPFAAAFSGYMTTYPGISHYEEDRQRRLAAASAAGRDRQEEQA